MPPPGRWQAARVGRKTQALDGRAAHLRTVDGDRVVSVLLKTRMESSISRKEEGVNTCLLTPLSTSFRQTLSYLSLSRSVALNDGQDQMRGARAVMIDAVDRLHKILLCFRLNRSAGVRIAVKTWEVGASGRSIQHWYFFKNENLDLQVVHSTP